MKYVAAFYAVVEADTISEVDDYAMIDPLVSFPGVVEVGSLGVVALDESFDRTPWAAVSDMIHP
jgi:hypothetical protein